MERLRLESVCKKGIYSPGIKLEDHIWNRLCERDTRIVRTKFYCFTILSLASLGASILVIRTLARELTQSGFYEYLSLIFSDSGSVATYWKEFIFSLAESIPTVSIMLILTLLSLFLLSLRHIARSIIQNKLVTSQ